ncbi:MAG: hypothetical protein WAU39_13980 [Polyangiales bacterium]
MTLLLVQAITTWALTALIWFVQLVQYPSFSRVGVQFFPAFHSYHSSRITFIVAPLMIAEAVSALALSWQPGRGMAPWEIWVGIGLVALIWASTFLLQVPMHGRLSKGFDEEAWRFLVTSNWVRTVAWSLRAVLVTVWLRRALEQGAPLLGS